MVLPVVSPVKWPRPILQGVLLRSLTSKGAMNLFGVGWSWHTHLHETGDH